MDKNKGIKKKYPDDIQDRIRAAEVLMQKCQICERRCSVNRLEDERGFCSMGRNPVVFAEYLNYGMELHLAPSYSIYFSGCNFRCVYCITYENVFQAGNGKILTSEELADAINRSAGQCVKSVNFVGGLPEIHLLPILEAISMVKVKPVISWDSNMFMTPETLEILNGVVDLYIADLRYGSNTCAEKYSGIRDYCRIVRRNLVSAARHSKILARFLLLPGHLKCCYEPSVRWLAENVKESDVSFFPHYYPAHRAHTIDEISEPINDGQIIKAARFASELGLRVIDDGISSSTLTTRMQDLNSEAVITSKSSTGTFCFETEITIDKYGRVNLKNLNSDMVEIANLICPGDENVAARVNIKSRIEAERRREALSAKR